MSKKQLVEALQNFFESGANETYSFKQIFKSLHLDTHPAENAGD